MRTRVFDFFSGCGGTSLGLQAAGMRIVAGIEWDADAGRSFKRNFPRARLFGKDIRNVRTGDLAHLLPARRRAPVLFACCAPCQPFSKQNGNRRRDDERKNLVGQFVRFVRRYQPEYVLCENVPGAGGGSGPRGPFVGLKRLLTQLKYKWAEGVVNSWDYGVPQHRRRYVMLASRLGAVSIPRATHGPKRRWPRATAWEWIKGLRPLKAGQSDPKDPMHRAFKLSAKNLRRLRATPRGGSRRDWPKHLRLACHRGHGGHSDAYGRVRKHAPATAMTTKCISLSNGRFGHPVQDRALSAREAACLQTFPRSVMLEGSLLSMARQVGNAVPVLLARRLGKHLTRPSEVAAS